MALQTRISIAAAIDAVDAVADRAENGTGANCKVLIYNGSQPASPDATVGGATLLASIDLGTTTPVFGNATTNGNYAEATASAILPKSDTSANATGTAAWFRATDQGGNAFIDGDVGTSTGTADMAIDSTAITAGQTVKLNSWKIRLLKTG
jgi:hypothetical protein